MVIDQKEVNIHGDVTHMGTLTDADTCSNKMNSGGFIQERDEARTLQ